ncbi:MAG TPA: hypothetical protein PLA46_04795, partial [Phycicoccus sp.]|nr:hypothetical protein [Phycicoccus sp.]
TARASWWMGPLLILCGVAATVVLRTRATVDCDVGINVGAAMLGTHLKAVLMVLVLVPLAEVARRLLPRGLALTAIVLVVLAASLWLLADSAPPIDYPQSVLGCPGNRPLWWPTWLPG